MGAGGKLLLMDLCRSTCLRAGLLSTGGFVVYGRVCCLRAGLETRPYCDLIYGSSAF
jgi:hypothetical protein